LHIPLKNSLCRKLITFVIRLISVFAAVDVVHFISSPII
jgi:hypothetical protein